MAPGYEAQPHFFLCVLFGCVITDIETMSILLTPLLINSDDLQTICGYPLLGMLLIVDTALLATYV